MRIAPPAVNHVAQPLVSFYCFKIYLDGQLHGASSEARYSANCLVVLLALFICTGLVVRQEIMTTTRQPRTTDFVPVPVHRNVLFTSTANPLRVARLIRPRHVSHRGGQSTEGRSFNANSITPLSLRCLPLTDIPPP